MLIATHGTRVLAARPEEDDIDHAAVAAMADLGLTGPYVITTAMEPDGDGWRRTPASQDSRRWFDGGVVR